MTPTNARRVLRKIWSRVAVYSCADGTLKLEPVWAKAFRRPGVLTRMHSAAMIEDVLGLPRKRIDWKKRSTAAEQRQEEGE